MIGWWVLLLGVVMLLGATGFTVRAFVVGVLGAFLLFSIALARRLGRRRAVPAAYTPGPAAGPMSAHRRRAARESRPFVPTGNDAEADRRVRAWLRGLEPGTSARFAEVRTLVKVARLYDAHRQPAEAISLCASWLHVAEASGDRLERSEVRKIFAMLASLHRAGDRPVETWELIERWLTVTERGSATPKELNALAEQVVATHRRTRVPDTAEIFLTRWLALAERTASDTSLALAAVLGARGAARVARGEPAAAEGDYVRARQVLEERLGPHHPEVLHATERHASVLRAIGREAEALALERQVSAVRDG